MTHAPLPPAGEEGACPSQADGKVRAGRFRAVNPHASRLRREQTVAERRLWTLVRDRRLGGYKFRRQATIGPFIADFACLEYGLVVELDGGHHADRVHEDAERTSDMEQRGFKVIRFWNDDVLRNADGVCDDILEALKALTPTLSRKRERGS